MEKKKSQKAPKLQCRYPIWYIQLLRLKAWGKGVDLDGNSFLLIFFSPAIEGFKDFAQKFITTFHDSADGSDKFSLAII